MTVVKNRVILGDVIKMSHVAKWVKIIVVLNIVAEMVLLK